MSRVFSTTIIEKIARMPKPATAMIMNSRILRMLCSMATAPRSGPLLLLPGRDVKEHGLQPLEPQLQAVGQLVDIHAGLDLDLDLVDRPGAVGSRQEPAISATARAAHKRESSHTRSSRS